MGRSGYKIKKEREAGRANVKESCLSFWLLLPKLIYHQTKNAYEILKVTSFPSITVTPEMEYSCVLPEPQMDVHRVDVTQRCELSCVGCSCFPMVVSTLALRYPELFLFYLSCYPLRVCFDSLCTGLWILIPTERHAHTTDIAALKEMSGTHYSK